MTSVAGAPGALSAERCWQLLDTRAYGRVCFCVEDRVHVVLTAYVPRQPVVYLRATAFGSAARETRRRPVTLEVDDMPANDQASWSVTLTGSSHRVEDAATLASLWTPVRPHPWEDGTEGMWIALDVDDIRGSRRHVR